MSSTFEEIIRAALALPPGLCAMLADPLLKSLDVDSQTEIDAAWELGIEQRIQDVQQGKTSLLSADQIFQELRN